MLSIGTRDSALAVWQAKFVQHLLEQQGCRSQLVYIKTDGDRDAVTPLYAMGVEGVFTKALDSALLSGTIDVAVHSMKDVPVDLAAGLVEAAVPERGNALDVFVPRIDARFMADPISAATIATCSIRRKAQWLRRYPAHAIVSIRGNVDTRLHKVYNSHWDGAIFAAAGLERLGLKPEHAVTLDWMVPAPAQGAILVVCREEDTGTREVCRRLNHEQTALCVAMERAFLKRLMGGCTAPISALAIVKDSQVHFKGQILSPDGLECIETDEYVSLDNPVRSGFGLAEALLARGADLLIQKVKENKLE